METKFCEQNHQKSLKDTCFVKAFAIYCSIAFDYVLFRYSEILKHCLDLYGEKIEYKGKSFCFYLL